MAASVGELRAVLSAHTAQFERKMGQANRTIGGFGKQMKAVAGRVAAFGGALLGVAGIGGIGVMIKRNLELMDSTAKLADRLGVTTERLQGLRHAAELSGAGAKTLDAGLGTMAKRLGEAERGTGAATAALKELGLSAKALVKMGMDEAFFEIAAAIAKVEEPAKRAAIVANIFSKANMALQTTLEMNKRGLEEAGKAAATFSRETAAKAEAANDAMTNLGESIKKITVSAVAELADEIENLAKAMAKIPGKAKSMIAAFREWSGKPGLVNLRLTPPTGWSTPPKPPTMQRPTAKTVPSSPGFEYLDKAYVDFFDKWWPEAQKRTARTLQEALERNRARLEGGPAMFKQLQQPTPDLRLPAAEAALSAAAYSSIVNAQKSGPQAKLLDETRRQGRDLGDIRRSNDDILEAVRKPRVVEIPR